LSFTCQEKTGETQAEKAVCSRRLPPPPQKKKKEKTAVKGQPENPWGGPVCA